MKGFKSKFISLILILALVFSFTFTGESFADDNIRLIIENDALKVEDGAAWDGVLLDEEVPLDEDKNLLEIIEDVVSSKEMPIEIADSAWGRYLVSIDGLKHDNGGYTFLLNDEFPDKGMEDYSVALGNLKAGDVVKVEFGIYSSGGDDGDEDEKDDLELVDLPSVFPSFRGNKDNNGVVNTSLPISLDNVKLRNVINLGDDWDKGLSQMIVVDNHLISMDTNNIYKLDTLTGEILREEKLAQTSAYGMVAPTYAEGMIFIPLNDGTIQAINANTFETLWTYEDELKGQGLNPLTYDEGVVYGGFWNSNGASNFVAIDAKNNTEDDFVVTNEKATKQVEKTNPLWTLELPSGQYWQGSVVVGDYILLGDDDGVIYSVNKKSGDVIDKETFTGKIRSTLVNVDGTIYFTSSDGAINKVSVDQNGKLYGKKSESIGNASTSTPAIYKDKIYVTVLDNSVGYLKVLDTDFKGFEAVELKAYSQSSPLVNTINEKDGYIDVYVSYNAQPGGLSLIRINEEGYDLIEIYEAEGYEQWSTGSAVVDNNGNLIYKNDSGNIFVLGKIKEEPTPEEPTPEEPTPEEPTPEEPTPDKPTPDKPTPDDKTNVVDKTDKDKDKDNAPKTGDVSLALPIVLIVVAILGIIYIKRKKRS